MEVAADNMLASSAHLHQLHGVAPIDNLDIAVTSDGTWSKRGYHGIVVVIAWESGQVLDFEVKSCARLKEKLGEDSPEFGEWWEGHQDECECNHDGSSPAMECSAAADLFKRSEENFTCGTEVISDGDSKTISHLNEIKPYGEGAPVIRNLYFEVGTRNQTVWMPLMVLLMYMA